MKRIERTWLIRRLRCRHPKSKHRLLCPDAEEPAYWCSVCGSIRDLALPGGWRHPESYGPIIRIEDE